MAASSPRVSVIVPTRDRCTLLLETLESVRKQTHADWEAVVVDDGSTDGTAAAVGRLARDEPRIRIETSPSPGSGPAVCRNQALRGTRAPFVLFLDSDDLLDPECLAGRLRRLGASPGLDFVVSQAQVFRQQPGDRGLLFNAFTDEDDLDRFLRLDFVWQTAGALWRRASFERLGAWDESLETWEDWELHVRALVRGFRYEKSALPDFHYRSGSGPGAHLGGRSRTAAALRARGPVLEHVVRLLEENERLDSARRTLVGGLWFRVAERLRTAGGSAGDALSLWRRCRELGLVDASADRAVRVYLRLFGAGRLRGPLRRRVGRHWPEGTLRQESTTFLRTSAESVPAAGGPS